MRKGFSLRKVMKNDDTHAQQKYAMRAFAFDRAATMKRMFRKQKRIQSSKIKTIIQHLCNIMTAYVLYTMLLPFKEIQ